jgi:hypothetical protein
MLELTVLLFSIAILLLIIYYNDTQSNMISLETFQNQNQNQYLSSCPSGYKTFYDSTGDIVCCDGDIVANRCIGDNKCKLSGKGTPDMPNCVDLLLKTYTDKSKSQCPNSMSTYFEDKSKKIKGCTQGELNDTLNAPKHTSQPVCNIYSTFDENRLSKDSCYNYKMLDNVQCFGNNCTKEIVQPNQNAPPLVSVGFTDNSGMHRVAYTKQSMENYLDATNPSWRNQGMDLSKNINIVEVAKAYYIDRTMDQSNIQF